MHYKQQNTTETALPSTFEEMTVFVEIESSVYEHGGWIIQDVNCV